MILTNLFWLLLLWARELSSKVSLKKNRIFFMKYIRFTQSIEEVDIFIPKNLISSMDKRPNVVANDWFYFESSWKGNVISYRISIKNEGTGGHSNVYKTHIYWLDTWMSLGPSRFAQISCNTFEKKTKQSQLLWHLLRMCSNEELSNIHNKNRILLLFQLKLSIGNHLKHR